MNRDPRTTEALLLYICLEKNEPDDKLVVDCCSVSVVDHAPCLDVCHGLSPA